MTFAPDKADRAFFEVGLHGRVHVQVRRRMLFISLSERVHCLRPTASAAIYEATFLLFSEINNIIDNSSNNTTTRGSRATIANTFSTGSHTSVG